jgi:hypothetical protein
MASHGLSWVRLFLASPAPISENFPHPSTSFHIEFFMVWLPRSAPLGHQGKSRQVKAYQAISRQKFFAARFLLWPVRLGPLWFPPRAWHAVALCCTSCCTSCCTFKNSETSCKQGLLRICCTCCTLNLRGGGKKHLAPSAICHLDLSRPKPLFPPRAIHAAASPAFPVREETQCFKGFQGF